MTPIELMGEMRRCLSVLKMRGSWHEKEVREYVIDGMGLHIKGPFRGLSGILSGRPTQSFEVEWGRLDEMFDEASGAAAVRRRTAGSAPPT